METFKDKVAVVTGGAQGIGRCIWKYAISHSPDYREAYHPHYRIVERSIFEKEIKHLIEPKK